MKEASNQLWLEIIAKEFDEVLKLRANWNSYGARQVEPECIRFVLEELLPFAMRPSIPVPAVVPTNRGGIVLEWHTRGIDLEVEVVLPGCLHIFYEDAQTGESWEGEVSSDLAPLDTPLEVHSQRQ